MAAKRKRKPKLEDKAQSRRFVETARKLESDESGKSFERVLNSIAATVNIDSPVSDIVHKRQKVRSNAK